MAKEDDPTALQREKPRRSKIARERVARARVARAMKGETGEAPSSEGTAPDDEILDLATEEAAIEKEAARLKKERERERELAKFTANFFDRASTSAVTVGLIGPGVGFLYHTSLIAAGLKEGELVTATLICLGAAAVLHWVGREILFQEFQR